MTRLGAAEIEKLDPYLFMALLGKRVIHPGGRRATEQLLERAQIREGERVLDIGCGVGTTAVAIARRYGADVTAADISPLMVERARENVRAAGLEGKVPVEYGDIVSLPYGDGEFDCVLAEAVTMFVNRRAAARSLVRICRPGGRVLATEFMWRKPPTEEARQAFLGEVCPGMRFDTLEDWIRLYSEAGLEEVGIDSGPFEMMTPKGFVQDEGMIESLKIVGRVVSRRAHISKMLWLMPRMMRAVPYLGYVVVAGRKPLEVVTQPPQVAAEVT